jgi:hypothetical protein
VSIAAAISCSAKMAENGTKHIGHVESDDWCAQGIREDLGNEG